MSTEPTKTDTGPEAQSGAFGLQLLLCDDGSHTLYRPDLDETYHSRAGALSESRHVYIEAGLLPLAKAAVAQGKTRLALLEIGLGTGLNALLSAWAIRDFPSLHLDYVALEPYPLPVELWSRLNYPDFFLDPSEARAALERLHRSPWDLSQEWFSQLQLLKIKASLEQTAFEPNTFDLIYFDAFAPNKQSEPWERAALKKLTLALKPGGLFVTYCARGSFKRQLRALGYQVENPPGPPPKREMTRATRVLLDS